MEYEKYIQRLKNDVPRLADEGIKVIGSGWDHVALEAGGLIFRLPYEEQKNEARETQVKTEVAVLRMLKDKLPVAIPDPVYIDKSFEYFGYPKLPGRPVNEIFDDFSDTEKRLYVKRWVEIAASIHKALPAKQAKEIGVPAYSLVRVIANSRKISELKGTNGDIRKFADIVIAKADKMDLDSRPQTFLHNDLHFLNTLADEKSHDICGLIDWSDSTVGPIDREFAAWVWGPKEYLEEAARLYERKMGVKIDLEIARTIGYVEELSDFLEQTLEGDLKGAEESRQHILRWIAETR